MSTIKRGFDGNTELTFNRNLLSEGQMELLSYALTSFAFLVPPGKTITLFDFCDLIAEKYIVQGFVEQCIFVLRRAVIMQRYFCKFETCDYVSGAPEEPRFSEIHAVNSSDAIAQLRDIYGPSVHGIRVISAVLKFTKGVLRGLECSANSARSA